MIKFGKPSIDVLRYKTSFISDNDKLLNDYQRLFEIYIKQPKRLDCQNCSQKIRGKTFSKMQVNYCLCSVCGHLNGLYMDTDEFCSILYADDDGKEYATIYNVETKEDYQNRVKDIYLPKTKFLAEALLEQGKNHSIMSVVDIGAGSGYFLTALKKTGFLNIQGYEVSKSQIDLANKMLCKGLILQHNLNETIEIASKVETDIISLIGVLEHLQNPREFLSATTKNSSLKYLFLSLPLFSPTVFFEMIFDEVMPRHLVPFHTHLYTESSIDYFCKEFGFERVAEWWFGSDMMDLFRNVMVMLSKGESKSDAKDLWNDTFRDLMDDLQKTQDKRKKSSEVHMLLKLSE